MSEQAAVGMLTTLGEVGGVAGIVAVSVGLVLRLIKKNGCTCKLYSLQGKTLAEVDCEKGAPSQRYLPKTEDPSKRSGVELSAVSSVSELERSGT